MFKINGYIVEWARGIGDKSYKPTISWRKIFLKALLGLALVFVVYFIVQLGIGLFGVNITPL